MGETFLEYAKELFESGKVKEAHDMALLVANNDCNCRDVHQLVAIYGVLVHHNVSLRKIDCYRVLDVSLSASDKQIAHKFTSLKKLIHPARSVGYPVVADRTAAAAEKANSLVNFAFEVLSDEKSRQKFDACWYPSKKAPTRIRVVYPRNWLSNPTSRMNATATARV
ncbi:DnaJ homolog subfamily C member 25 [Linum grandiflorum]